jgi:hypothetical protein
MAKHDANTIIMFANDTTVVGLITDNNKTAYREVRDLAVWYQDNWYHTGQWCQWSQPLPQHDQDKGDDCELQEKEDRAHPILIDRAAVEQVESFKFHGVHITNKLTWSKHTRTVVKRARQNLLVSGD